MNTDASGSMETDDLDIIASLKQDNKQAFDTLYNKYISMLTGYGMRLTTDRQLVEDSLHDVFVWIWANRGKLDIRFSLKSYLSKSVRTNILHRLNKQKKVMGALPGDEEGQADAFTFYTPAEEAIIQKENDRLLSEKVLRLMEHLSPRQKEIVYLRCYQDLSFKDIAVLLDMNVKGCYKLMARALETLRSHYPAIILLFLLVVWGKKIDYSLL